MLYNLINHNFGQLFINCLINKVKLTFLCLILKKY